jgi:hypothetical protein
MQKLENSRPKPERMEETLEGGRGPPRAVASLERERMIFGGTQLKRLIPHFLHCAVTLSLSLSLRPKYFPQHPVLKRPQSVVVVLYM